MKILAVFTVILFAIAASFLPVSAGEIALQGGEEIYYSENFDSGAADGWDLESGWEVAPSEAGFALKGLGHVWVRLTQASWEDYILHFRLKLEGTQSSIHANVRQYGASRYFIGFNRHESYLSKQIGLDTFRENLATGYSIGGGWHAVEISAFGGQITVLVDGRRLMLYQDPDPLTSGGIAFESLAQQVVWVDDVEVLSSALAGGKPVSPGQATQVSGIGQLQWIYTGGPLGGLGYDVRMRPDNPDVIYVTDARAGIFRSQDGGKTWLPINSGITTRIGETGDLIPVFCLTIDPSDPDIVWAGTQNQTGAFKSTDGGDSWKKMDAGFTEQGLTLRGFTIDPRDSNIVYSAGEVSSWEWNGKETWGHEFDLVKGVVYKTTNGGQQWNKVWQGDNLARYIWIDPRDSNTVYVSTGIFDREAANSDYATGKAGGVGVIKSTDAGKTWTPVNNGLQNLYVGSLFMHPTNPDTLLAGTGVVTYEQGSGVYLSTDGGASWKKTLDTYVVSSVEIAVSDPQIAYAGNVSAFYRSQDGGYTWEQMTPPGERWGPEGVSVGTPIDFQVDPRDPNRVFVNAYGGGNFITTDGGLSWEVASKGYSGAMVRDIAVDPRGGARVYAASRSGIFVSSNAGEDWIGIATGDFKDNDWHSITLIPQQPDQLIAELNCRPRVVFSEDGGQRWQKAYQPSGNVGWRKIMVAPSDPKIAYAGSLGFVSCGAFDWSLPAEGVFVSQDGGLSWAPANDGLSRDAAVLDLSVHPNNPLFVFAATANKGLLKTEDGGSSWQPVNPSLFDGRMISSVAISPVNPDLVFAGRSQGGLARSQDGGGAWGMIAAGLNPEATVVDLAFDPTNPQVIYLADLFSGVYLSTNAGLSWRSINNGLTNRAVNALALSSDGQHLYAATEGRGVFRLDLNGQPPEPMPSLLLAPTETPAAASTAIRAAPLTAVAPGQPTEAPLATSTPTPGRTRPQLRCLASYVAIGLVAIGLIGWRKSRREP